MTPAEALLDLMLEHADPKLGWICRMSVTGRGLRLHQCEDPIGTVHEYANGRVVRATAQEAIADFVNDQAEKPTQAGDR